MIIQSLENSHHSCYSDPCHTPPKSCHKHPDPCHEHKHHKCSRGPRGIQGPPGITSTNDNAFFYYFNEVGLNTQNLAVGLDQELLINQSSINGSSIILTATDNDIILSPGIYSIEISTYADATGVTFAANSNITITPDIRPALAKVGTTEPFVITTPILQHIYIPSIISIGTSTQLLPQFSISTTNLDLTAITFINTTIKVIRLGNY